MLKSNDPLSQKVRSSEPQVQRVDPFLNPRALTAKQWYRYYSIPTHQFLTKWCNVWRDHVVNFTANSESNVWRNGRPIVYNAQREHHKLVQGLMYNRPHQPEY